MPISPGVTEMLGAIATFDYFGSLVEHDCHLARLAEVTDAASSIVACMGLRECGYDDPWVVEKVIAAAQIVADDELIPAIAFIDDRDELPDTILNGYGVVGQFRMVLQIDGSMLVRVDLPLVFHPATTGALWSFTPVGAV